MTEALIRTDDIDISKTVSVNLSSTDDTIDNSKDFVILGIAYYNLGTEFEYMKEYRKAVEVYEKGLETLNGKVACDVFIYQNLLKAAKNVKEKHTLLLNYHNDCAKARSLGSPRLLYMGRSEIDKRYIMASSRIKRGVKLNEYALPIEEASMLLVKMLVTEKRKESSVKRWDLGKFRLEGKRSLQVRYTSRGRASIQSTKLKELLGRSVMLMATLGQQRSRVLQREKQLVEWRWQGNPERQKSLLQKQKELRKLHKKIQ